jgi:hypothetical protein
VSAARSRRESRFDERESFRDAAVSRPPRFEAFDGADFAADLFDEAAAFLEAARAPCGLNKNIAETASAIRQGNRNFRVIEPSSLKNQAEEAARDAVALGGSAARPGHAPKMLLTLFCLRDKFGDAPCAARWCET